jgi:hypothetical protein
MENDGKIGKEYIRQEIYEKIISQFKNNTAFPVRLYCQLLFKFVLSESQQRRVLH